MKDFLDKKKKEILDDMTIEELESKAFHSISIEKISSICNPLSCWIELESPITEEEVLDCINSGNEELIKTPLYTKIIKNNISKKVLNRKITI